MRSILAAIVMSFSAIGLAQADDVSGKGTGADQKEACKAAQTQARGTTRKGINFEECQCTQADGKYSCTVKGATR